MLEVPRVAEEVCVDSVGYGIRLNVRQGGDGRRSIAWEAPVFVDAIHALFTKYTDQRLSRERLTLWLPSSVNGP